MSRRGETEVLGHELGCAPSVDQEAAWLEDVAEAVASMPDSCVLDLVEREPDGATLEQVASVFDLTRERIRQVETRAISRLRGGRCREALRDAGG